MCSVYFFIPIIKIWNKQVRCPNFADPPSLPDVTLYREDYQVYHYRVKSGKSGHQVNLDTHLQTVQIQMRRLLMSRLIRNFTVCWVNLFFIAITELWNKQGGCPNLAVCPNIPDFTLQIIFSSMLSFRVTEFHSQVQFHWHLMVAEAKDLYAFLKR